MGKQNFGGVWTVSKLEVVENYLKAYTTALKNQKFKLCYIDAFAGRGDVELKDGSVVSGSAIRSLNYHFDKYLFFETNSDYNKTLKERIASSASGKDIVVYNKNCNSYLQKIDEFDWYADGWRGAIFLDPYAMDLEWRSLININNTKIFDVWYLFPFSAVNRNLRNDMENAEQNIKAVNRILGTSDWQKAIYKESPQLSFLDEDEKIKVDPDGVRKYILERLQSVFPTVSKKAVLLRNAKRSPMFLLCFAGSNPNEKAKTLSLRMADHLLTNIESN